MEPLSAVVARVRPRVRVDEQVRRERRRTLEGLAALLARERPLVRVHRPAINEEEQDFVISKNIISYSLYQLL